jgi:hypothetical protein
MRKLFLLVPVFVCSLLAHSQTSHVVISQVYGGGGNSGANYKNDFIELFNPTGSTVNLSGWSVQYASATGTSWVLTPLSGSIAPYTYYLIQEAAGSGGTISLPTPNTTGSINMSATAGKVALVSNATALIGSCPTTGIIDFLGFGSTASCYEGIAAAQASSNNTNSILRLSNGCTDTNNNTADFSVGTAIPRNASSPTNICTAPVVATISVGAAVNAAEPFINGKFTISLSVAAPAGGVTLTYNLSGTANISSDYTDPQNGQVVVAEGSTSADVNINVVDDNIQETDENVVLTLNTPPSPYTLSAGTATITITDDDITPLIFTGTYIEDFNSLASTGTSAILPIGWAITESGTNANKIYTAGNGSINAGDTYSFGSSESTERALGGLRSGSVLPTIGAKIQNNTGSTLTTLTISYTGEQWRLGTSGRSDSLTFQYSTNATSLTTGTWTNVSALSFSSPNTSAIAGPLDGNAAGNRKLISAAIRGLNVQVGAIIWIRWNDYDASGADDGLSVDDIILKATANFPCDVPAAGPTNLVFPTITDASISGSFTAANPSADEYLVVMTSNSNLSSDPINGQTYAVGDNMGGGTVVSTGTATSFTATGLVGGATYNFFVYSINTICTDGPKYLTADGFVETGDATTLVPLPACIAPADQPGNLQLGIVTTNSIQGSFTGNGASDYLVIQSTEPLNSTPIDGQVYNAGAVIGNGGVVQKGSATSFTATSLQPNTRYYFTIFSLNSAACKNGPVYNTTNPLVLDVTTHPLPACAAPVAAPSDLVLHPSYNSITGTFNVSGSADSYLIVRSATESLIVNPVDNTDYVIGQTLGGGTVIASGSSSSFVATGLQPSTSYYFFVFAVNSNCTGGTKYFPTPVIASISTTAIPAYNVYFGNLHSHSDYSDGNKDHPGYTPADDYLYAKDAECMDFLGISEHNHFSSPDNPGNLITNYHQGFIQADTFTLSHPNFLALYGMEWGVISGGGHVVVYGDGMNELFGWESNVGGLTGPNYDVYVPKSTYTGPTGLFKAINDRSDKNTFAMLAHPNNTDFNNLSNNTYDAEADAAITGTAVESGPAFSTDTTYTNPSSMSYLWYYQKLLSKGYRVGPSLDHDNHNTTFGKTTRGRLAVMAPALNRTELFKAIREMHFYATEDCDAKVDFAINSRIMGSEFEDRNAPAIAVNITDFSHDFSTAKIRVMSGIPGSGINPVAIDSTYGTSLSFIDNNLPINATGYYYIEIYNDNSKIVTSPIWYKRLCINESTVTISRCDSYEWHGTVYTQSGNYTYSTADETGCTNIEHLALTIHPDPSAEITAGGPITFCPSGVVSLQANAATSYKWSEGSTTQSIEVSVSGTYSVTITDENGCSATSEPVNVSVQDITAPEVHTKNISVSLDATGSAVVSATDVNDGSTDDCSIAAVGYKLSQSIFNCSNVGPNTVTLTVTDASGNVASATAIVTVEDHFKPTVLTKNITIYMDANGAASISAADINNGSTDNCSITSLSVDKTTFRCSDLGNNTITLSAIDASGNTSSETAIVTVVDNLTPVISTCPVVPLQCYNPAGTYTIPPLSATDNCNYSVTYIITGASARAGIGNDASGSFNVGTSTITWTVKDESNNSVTCTTTVMINSPVISSVPDVMAVNPGGAANALYIGYGPSSLTLNSVVTGGTQPYSYKWTENSSAGPAMNNTSSYIVSPTSATSYFFNVKDVYGCTATKVVKTIEVADVRCGTKGDKVTVCQVIKGKATTSCVFSKDVASLLAGGATLGSCPVGSIVSSNYQENATGNLVIKALPNPSSQQFILSLQSGNSLPVSITVTDAIGRLLEKREGINANGFTTLGSSYRPGIYFLEVNQGNTRKTLKLIKQ